MKKKTTTVETKKYELLITAPGSITYEMVDKVAEQIENGIFQETACLTNNINPEAMNIIIKDFAKNYIGRYAKDAFKIASAKSEEKLVKKWISETTFNSKMIQAFLENTNPKFSNRYRTEIKYNILYLMDIVRANTTQKQYLKIIDDMQNVDEHGIVEELDKRFSK